MAASGKTGGYNCEFIDAVPADFLCESCGLVAREPSLTVCCGRHYCHSCISHLLRDCKPCPGCEAVPFSAFLDKNYQRKVLALRVHCMMKDCGCQWTGQSEQLDAHLDVETGDCEYVDIECPEKCGHQIQKHQLAAHLETCHSQVVECDFSYAGCNKKLQRQDMEKHMEESTQEHLTLMAAANVKMSREFKKLQEQFRGYVEQKEKETAEQFKQKDKEIKHFQESFQETQKALQVANEKLQQLEAELRQQTQQLQKRQGELQNKQNRQIQTLDTKIQEKTSQIERRMYDCENYNFPLVRVKLEDKSQFMHTHSGGYKFRFVISEQGLHVSVKLEAHSGPFDDSLQWPAKCTITLRLLNQHRDQDHVTVTKELEWEEPKVEGLDIPALGYRKADGEARRRNKPVSTLISDKFIACNELWWNAERQTQYIKNDYLHFKVTGIQF